MFLGPASSEQAATSRRLLDRPRLLVGVGVGLVAVVAATLFWLANRTRDLAPDLVTGVLLYALLAVNLLLLVALGFVLARNVLKLWVEERRAAPFGRFRAKLVVALLAMTVMPALLVLVSGSQLIRESAARWFSEPVDEVLSASKDIAQRYYRDLETQVMLRARGLARVVPPGAVTAGTTAIVGPSIEEAPKTMPDGLVEIYRVIRMAGASADVEFLVGAGSPNLPAGHTLPPADRIAARTLATGRDESTEDELDSGGALIRAASPIRNADQEVVGVAVVSQYVAADVRTRALQATAAYERYQGLRVLRGPIQGIYQSVFLAVTLLILISATWLGLYLAKRITRPVQLLAAGARAIGEGRLDMRVQAESTDELGALVESFNMMAAELETSRGRLERSQRDLEQKNREVDARRRYIETILERVATGVISLDADGRVSTVNGAAERVLGLGPGAVGRPAIDVFDRSDLGALRPFIETSLRKGAGATVEEITLVREEREVHLAVAVTALVGDAGRAEGAVIVLDDVTPLIRAQRVAAWRDVARRLAHEIKNPLTPIQLSAERLRRHFGGAPPQTRALVAECTEAIVTEVESLKGLVDEFAAFARLRAPRMARHDVNRLIEGALQLYAGVWSPGGAKVTPVFDRSIPSVSLDPEQIRQVIINLVDNALEALGGPAGPDRPDGSQPEIVIRTSYVRDLDLVRILVTDNGPGVSAADRDKLFMPYYSTKGRGSGLGLAIVRRIVVEHGGTITVADAVPGGAAFTIDLPCQPS